MIDLKLKLAFISCAAYLLSGCNGFSNYPLDKEPIVKIDASLLGQWRIVGDIDKDNFITIRKAGQWDGDKKFPAMSANATEDIKKHEHHRYYVTYWNDHGKNPLYMDRTAFLSQLSGTTFINLFCRDRPTDSIEIAALKTYGHTTASIEQLSSAGTKFKDGYCFFKILSVSKTHDSFSVAVVSDPHLKYLKNSTEVKNWVSKNRNSPGFYSDTIRLYRTKIIR